MPLSQALAHCQERSKRKIKELLSTKARELFPRIRSLQRAEVLHEHRRGSNPVFQPAVTPAALSLSYQCEDIIAQTRRVSAGFVVLRYESFRGGVIVQETRLVPELRSYLFRPTLVKIGLLRFHHGSLLLGREPNRSQGSNHRARRSQNHQQGLLP